MTAPSSVLSAANSERGRSVALVVMRKRLRAPLLQRQPWLSAVQRLDLAFFVAAKHQRVLGWIQIQTDDVLEFFRKAFVVGNLERLDQVRLEPIGVPNSAYARLADADGSSHRAGTPVRRVRRDFACGLRNHSAHFRRRDLTLSSRARRIALNPNRSLLKKALAPARRCAPAYLQFGCDRLVGHALCRQQNHLRSLRQTHLDATPTRPSLKLACLRFGDRDSRCDSHVCGPLILQTSQSHFSFIILDALH